MQHADLKIVSRFEGVETDDSGPHMGLARAGGDASHEPVVGVMRAMPAMNAIVATIREGIAVLEPGGRCVLFNPQMAAITGHTKAEVERPGLFARMFPERAQRAEALAGMARAWRGQDLVEQPCRIVGSDGSPRELLISTRLFDADGGPRLLVAACDTTESRRREDQRLAVERQLREAERLESLAAMAGGMAHDFNNLLQVIFGFSEVAAAGLVADSEAWAALAQVRAAARRAAELTRKMLAYAGGARFVPRALDLSQLVARARPLLAASLTDTQWLEVELAGDVPAIDGDAVQLRQLLINLVANASEALAERGGRVVVRTGTIDCDAAYLGGCHAGHGLPGGRHVYLEVEDSGCGIVEGARGRLFDPFFSTKFTGRGLGLAAVLGVARGHRGAIDVRSAVGVGTRMRVLLPVAAGP